MPRKGNHIKAMFLLMVFSLNTVVSFACSLSGVFHSFHHHTPSSKHQKVQGHHHPKKEHRHNHGTPSHQHEKKTSGKPDDDCCSTNVVVVEKMEKAVSRAIQAPDAVSLISFLNVYSSVFSLFPVEEKAFYPDIVRWRLPATIQDLRIVIQSFQI